MWSPSRRAVRSLRQVFVAPILAVAFGVVLMAGDANPPGADSPPWDGATWRRVSDPATGLSFDVPMLGFRLETRHFDTKAEPGTVRDSFTIEGPGGLEATLELFDNPQRASIAHYLDSHLGFLRGGPVSMSGGAAGKARVAAILIESPRGPGTFAQRSAVFALGDRVYALTCHDTDDARAAAVFARVLDTLEEGASR